MWKHTVLLLSIVLSLSLLVRQIDSVCNQCKNGHACISEKEFQICYTDRPNTNTTYTCPNDGDVCSQYGQICMPRESGIVPACRGIQNCVCDQILDFMFVCTSRTTFTMCYNQTYTTTRGTCPQNQLCDVRKGASGEIPCSNLCIDDVADAALCDFQDPVDQPSTPSPTNPTIATNPTTNPATNTSGTTSSTVVVITATPPSMPNDICRNQTKAGRFPLPNDTACISYVSCFWNGSEYSGRQVACPTGKYFNSGTSNCQTTKPTGCA